MLHKKRWVKVIALGLLLAVVVSSMALAQKKTITFMSAEVDPRSVNIDKFFVNEFQEKYPEVRVFSQYVGNLQRKLWPMVQAGIAPDVIYVGATETYHLYELGAVLPVDDVIERLGDISPNFLVSSKFDGHFYAVPIQSGGVFLWFRNDWFASKGLLAPRTWGDVLKAAEKLTDKAKDIYGIGLVGVAGWMNQDEFGNRFWCAGGHFFDEQKRVAFSTKYRKESLKTLAYLKALSEFAPPGFVGHNYVDKRMAFIQEKTAVIWECTRVPGDIARASPKLNKPGVVGIAAALVPDEGGKHVMMDGPDLWVISKDTEYPDVSKNFIYEYLSGESYIKFLLSVPFHLWPVRETYAKDPRFVGDPKISAHPDWLKTLQETMDIRVDPSMEYPGVFNEKWGSCWQSYTLGTALNYFYAGKLSAEEAIDRAAREWQDISGRELAPMD